MAAPVLIVPFPPTVGHFNVMPGEMEAPASQVYVTAVIVGSGACVLVDPVKVQKRRRIFLWNNGANHAYMMALPQGLTAAQVAAGFTYTASNQDYSTPPLAASTGFPVPSGFNAPPLEVNITDQLDVWAITASGNTDIRVWQESWD